MDRAASYGGSGAYQGGKVLARKASNRIKTKIRSQKASDAIYDVQHTGKEGAEVTGTRGEYPMSWEIKRKAIGILRVGKTKHQPGKG